jgi:hypothetical protein
MRRRTVARLLLRKTAIPIQRSDRPVTRTIAVARADQQITFEALGDKTFGDADFNVTATASSALAVSFAAGRELHADWRAGPPDRRRRLHHHGVTGWR